MAEIYINKCLSNDLIIKSVENYLFRTGLCIETNNKYSVQKRSLINKPIVLFIISLIFFIKHNINCLINKRITYLSIILGDFGNFIGLKIEFTIVCDLMLILCIGSQIIYYYNYKNGIKPTFLRVFEMMSGLVSPKSIGLSDEKEILKLLRKTRLLFKYSKINNEKIAPILCLLNLLIPYLLNSSTIETIIFGIPNLFLFVVHNYELQNIIVYQFFYFYLLCYYLKNEIHSINRSIKEKLNNSELLRIMYSLDSLYKEINEYNSQFWSKFLLLFWITMGSISTFIYFMVIFKSFVLIIKIVFLYFALVFFLNIFINNIHGFGSQL